jgi:hypothetical protein
MNLSPAGADQWLSQRFIQTKEKAMTRKLTLTLAAAATLAFAAFVPSSADAMVSHGSRGGPGGHINIHVYRPHFHDHVRYWHFRDHRYVRAVGYVRPVVEGTCNCLTKEYTPEGVVVFKDLCTKEMASAPVDGLPEKESEVQSPSNFAGKTYQDYLAANPQAQTAAKKN